MHHAVTRTIARSDDTRRGGPGGADEDQAACDGDSKLKAVQRRELLAVLQVLGKSSSGDDVELENLSQFRNVFWVEKVLEGRRRDLGERSVVGRKHSKWAFAGEGVGEVRVNESRDER